MIRLWRDAWTEFVPFPDYDLEIRKVLCSASAIESLNARFRRAVRARGHFPNEQAAFKTPYLIVRSSDPKGTGQARWGMRWKPALNALATTFADRMPAAPTTQQKPPHTPLTRQTPTVECKRTCGGGQWMLHNASVDQPATKPIVFSGVHPSTEGNLPMVVRRSLANREPGSTCGSK